MCQFTGNIDFEYSSFTNWNLYTGTAVVGHQTPQYQLPTLNIPNTPITLIDSNVFHDNNSEIRFSIMTVDSGINVNDPMVPFIPVVSPWGGNYSIKMGNANPNSEAERIRFIYSVNSTNSNLIFHYALVFKDNNQPTYKQPAFRIKLTQANTLITSPNNVFNECPETLNQISTPYYNSDFYDTISYRNWTLASFDLSSYIGQNVWIEATVNDCALGAAFGYCYLDFNYDGNLLTDSLSDSLTTGYVEQIISNNSSNPIYLSAPQGYTNYRWYSNNTYNNILAGNIISNNDSLLVTLNDTSSTFYLKMSFLNATPGSISPQLNYNLIVQSLITNIEDNNIKPACNLMYQLENSLFINNCNSRGKIIIYNLLGEIYFSNEIKTEDIKINLSTYPEGIYFYNYSNGNVNETKRFVVVK